MCLFPPLFFPDSHSCAFAALNDAQKLCRRIGVFHLDISFLNRKGLKDPKASFFLKGPRGLLGTGDRYFGAVRKYLRPRFGMLSEEFFNRQAPVCGFLKSYGRLLFFSLALEKKSQH
jgi:hypothetical protein